MSVIIDKYRKRAENAESLLCIGLDSIPERMPERFRFETTPQFAFNRWIIDQTHHYVCAYKPNIAFYEARGDQGLHELKLTVDYLRATYPDVVTICDAKRADISSTNDGYVEGILDRLGFDAITLHPYLGGEALRPFLDRKDKACIILCRTSNPNSGEFQNLSVDDKPLWQVVAEQVSSKWNANDNCMLVTGATYPEELAQVRRIVGDMPLLVPGIGTQGGDLQAVLAAGLDSNGIGLIINSARNIIYADNPEQAARQLYEEIRRR